MFKSYAGSLLWYSFKKSFCNFPLLPSDTHISVIPDCQVHCMSWSVTGGLSLGGICHGSCRQAQIVTWSTRFVPVSPRHNISQAGPCCFPAVSLPTPALATGMAPSILDRSLTLYRMSPHIWIFNLQNGFQICSLSSSSLLPPLFKVPPLLVSTVVRHSQLASLTTGSWPFSVYFPHSIHLHFSNANLILSLPV